MRFSLEASALDDWNYKSIHVGLSQENIPESENEKHNE